MQTSDEGPAQEGGGRFSIPGGFGIKLMLFFSKIPLTRCAEQEKQLLVSDLSSPSARFRILWCLVWALFPSGGLNKVLQAEELWEFVLVVVHKSPSVFTSNGDVGWDQWESPAEKWNGGAVTQCDKMLMDFYPNTEETAA